MSFLVSGVKTKKITTTNCVNHLTGHHSSFASALKKKKDLLISKKTTSSTTTLQTHLDKKAKVVVAFTQEGFIERFLKLVVLTDQSFLFAENEVLIDLLTFLRPGLKVPKRKKLAALLEAKYRYKKDELKLFFKTVSVLIS